MDLDNIPDEAMAGLLEVPLDFASRLHERIYGEDDEIEWTAFLVPMEVADIRMGIFIVVGTRSEDQRFRVIYIVKPENQARMEFSIGHADAKASRVEWYPVRLDPDDVGDRYIWGDVIH